jgi:hypothetical protein
MAKARPSHHSSSDRWFSFPCGGSERDFIFFTRRRERSNERSVRSVEICRGIGRKAFICFATTTTTSSRLCDTYVADYTGVPSTYGGLFSSTTFRRQ